MSKDTHPDNRPPVTPSQAGALALDPFATGATTAQAFSERLFGITDIRTMYDALRERSTTTRDHDLAGASDMLTAQAAALNSIFADLASRSAASFDSGSPAGEAFLRLALKAQAQCRATLETLVNLRSAPVVYARQANIVNGPQQINNGASPLRGGDVTGVPNELLEPNDVERLEPRATSSTIIGNTAMEAMGALDGAADSARQGSLWPKRGQGRKTAGTSR